MWICSFCPLSVVETNDAAEDEEACIDDAVLKDKRLNIYGTAPRSKVSQTEFFW